MFLRGQIHQLGRHLVVGKGATDFQDFAHRAVQRLDGVGRVDDLADLRRVGEETRQLLPVLIPGAVDRRVACVPGLAESGQVLLSFLDRR